MADKKLIPYVILDSSVLTNGMRVLVDGVDISYFQKNPVMLYDHNDYQLPIGRWDNVRKENGMILADADLDYEDKDPFTQQIIGKIERGYLKACTPGLVDLELSDDPMYMLPDQKDYTVTRCRLREISITPIGKNKNALKLYDKDGNVLDMSDKPESKLLLSAFIVSPKIEKQMDKIYLSKLNLSDKATDVEIDAAISLLLSDKQKADERAQTAEQKLNELLLADKQAKRSAFEKELDAAFKDGRLSEKPEGDKLTPVKDGMLNLFDKDPEGTRTMLRSIAKPTSLDKLDLGDKDSKEFKELEAMDYGQMDKAGKVLLCKDKYPEMYKEKFVAKFGKEPKMSE